MSCYMNSLSIFLQTVFKGLVKLEADHDKAMKEAHSRDNITVRWDWALNKRRVAYFYFPKDDADVKVLMGDELRCVLLLPSTANTCDSHRKCRDIVKLCSNPCICCASNHVCTFCIFLSTVVINPRHRCATAQLMLCYEKRLEPLVPTAWFVRWLQAAPP